MIDNLSIAVGKFKGAFQFSLRSWTEWAIQSRKRMWVATGVVSSVLSCGMFALNWFTYYETMRLVIESQQRMYVQQLAVLYEDTGFPREDLKAFKLRAAQALSSMRGHIEILGVGESDENWIIRGQEWRLDDDRTRVGLNMNLGSGNLHLTGVTVKIIDSNRPPYLTALARSWTWSIADLIKSPDYWMSRRMAFRSFPLWVPFLMMWIAGYMALHAVAELVDLRQKTLRDGLKRFDGLAGLRRTDLTIKDNQLKNKQSELAELDVELARQKQVESGRVDLLEKELLEGKRLFAKMQQERDELEQLLEVADSDIKKMRPEATIARRVLAKLGTEQKIEEWIYLLDSHKADATKLPPEDLKFDKIRRQLKKWVRPHPDGTQQRWSEHSKKVVVSDIYNKIDRTLLNDFFVLARNGHYRDKHQKSIIVQPLEGAGKAGELHIVLKDDKGRCLCLRYEMRGNKGLPDVERIGFALAVLLRAVNKEFEDFRIK